MNKFLIKNPIISEKAVDFSRLGKYAFLVDEKASVSEIKKIVESQYHVNVIKTNTINVKPKIKMHGRSKGVKPGYKKVIVTLKKGQKLDILPQ